MSLPLHLQGDYSSTKHNVSCNMFLLNQGESPFPEIASQQPVFQLIDQDWGTWPPLPAEEVRKATNLGESKENDYWVDSHQHLQHYYTRYWVTMSQCYKWRSYISPRYIEKRKISLPSFPKCSPYVWIRTIKDRKTSWNKDRSDFTSSSLHGAYFSYIGSYA